MLVVLKRLETVIHTPVSQYKGDVRGNNNMKDSSLLLQFPMKPTMQSSQTGHGLNPDTVLNDLPKPSFTEKYDCFCVILS